MPGSHLQKTKVYAENRGDRLDLIKNQIVITKVWKPKTKKEQIGPFGELGPNV